MREILPVDIEKFNFPEIVHSRSQLPLSKKMYM